MKNQFKPIALMLLFALSFTFHGFGQAPNPTEGGGDKRERIQAAKVAFIASRLNLNTSQAQQFWPVFNEFEAAKKKIKKQMKQLRIDNIMMDGSDDQLKTDIKKFFSLRQEELDLEKSYSDKFLKAISPKQLVDYYRCEKEFTRILLKKLKERRGGRNWDKDKKDPEDE